MEEEKEGGIHLRFFCGLYSLPINFEPFCGKIFELFHPPPVEKTDDNVLPPVDPEERKDAPALDQGQDNNGEIGDEKEGGVRSQLTQQFFQLLFALGIKFVCHFFRLFL